MKLYRPELDEDDMDYLTDLIVADQATLASATTDAGKQYLRHTGTVLAKLEQAEPTEVVTGS